MPNVMPLSKMGTAEMGRFVIANLARTTAALPTVTIKGNKQVPVTSFREASAIVRAWMKPGASSRTFYRVGADNGAIRVGGEVVARVSFNGRVWCAKCEGEIDGAPSDCVTSRNPCKCGNGDLPVCA